MSLLEELKQRPYKEGISPTPEIGETGGDLLSQLKQKPIAPDVQERQNSVVEFLKSVFYEPIEFGKDIAMSINPTARRDFLVAQENRVKALNDIADKYRKKEIGYDTAKRLQKMITGSEPELPKYFKKTTTQIIGDVLGTLLWILPAGEITKLKKLSLISRVARGAGWGAAGMGTYGLATGETPKELAKSIATGAAIGAGAEVAAPIVFKQLGKAFKAIGRGIKKVGEKARPLYEWILPIEIRLRNLGPAGDEIADMLLAADRNAGAKIGTRLEELKRAGLYDLTKGERYTLHDVLKGYISPKKVNSRVRAVYQAADKVRREIAQEAQELGIKVRVLGRKGYDWKSIAKALDEGKINKFQFKEDFVITRGKKPRIKLAPFKPREHYYPQIVPPLTQLESGPVRNEVIENAVRIGRVVNKKEAEMLLDSYIDFVKAGGRRGRGEYWIRHLIRTGQAKTQEEARGMTLRFFKQPRSPRYGSLEYARELDFPFYDPDPARALTNYVIGASKRLSEVAQWGQKGRELDKLFAKLERTITKTQDYFAAKAAVKEARDLVNKALGVTNTLPKYAKISALLRTIQIPKLAFAQILNIGQSVNTLLATDLPSVAKGIQKAFTHEGQLAALRTGATLESIVREIARLSGEESRFATWFLKYTGFTWTEKFNRTVAALAGMKYSQRLLSKLAKNPTNKKILDALKELGIDGIQALKKGISEDDLLRAGQIMAEKTQFRARPIDLPAFASSAYGKVFFQFKNFIYNQTRFIYNQTVKELQKGHYGRGVRNLILLSTVFPLTGEILADIRSLATGSKRPTGALARYFDSMAEVGAFGLFADLMTSAKLDRLADFFLGPTASSAERIMVIFTKLATTGKISNSDKRFLISIPGITRPLANYLFPSKSKERKTILEILGD